MLTAARRFTDRIWAVEGCNSIGCKTDPVDPHSVAPTPAAARASMPSWLLPKETLLQRSVLRRYRPWLDARGRR
ncbi:hypothetical protein GCM10027088_10380 [Nocardia goodfellowii]